ncbi:hypothetical protein B0H63DRAFT_471065 [Podospora didyma]|uniref:Uncharacterized protein n=1 Tax=Podospora didyma TaxID=330526 RepID=A0AAE0NUF7_9PEZI|nr:hypothetical protein B0H63DRAFT_471065 [Podospora didyma]
MDWESVKTFLGLFSALVAAVLFFSLIAIWREKQWTGRLRMMSGCAQFIHGGAAIHLYSVLRKTFGSDEFAPNSRALVISTGIKGIVGILAVAWSIAVAYIVRKHLSRHQVSTYYKTKTKKASRGYFYLFLVDVAIIACLAVSVAYGRTSLPPDLLGCDDLPLPSARLFFRIGRALGEEGEDASPGTCRRVLATQMMTIILMAVMVVQSALFLPFMNLPVSLRAGLFFAVRLLRTLFCLDRNKNHYKDIEMGRDMDKKDEKKSLASVFRESDIAANISSHLHYSDVVNVSLSSKKVRSAVLAGPEKDRHSDRIELLAESSCEGMGKSQCWGCARVICLGCKVLKENVKDTRTMQHMTDCHAICTRCYLLRAPVEPAPLGATLHPDDISKQLRTLQNESAGQVELCSHCSTLAPDDITALREGREKEALQIALRRRLYCARCEKGLPRGSMRWWICHKGNHECHWAGHDVTKKSRW